MALTTKPRPGSIHKKVKAGHHRHSKNYLKTYWPYIPVIGILGIGFIVDSAWHAKAAQTGYIGLSANNYFGVVLESMIAALALAIFLLRNAFAWHKVLIEGEEFAAKHPLLDITLIVLATGGMILAHNGIAII